MDTVLLDPPLVALDKDAPVPYAGRKCKCKITNTLISVVQQSTHILIEYSMFIYAHSTQSVSHTHTHTNREDFDEDASVLCAGNCGNFTPQDKNR